MQNTKLNNAKKAKNDEFYTLYEDIEKEVGAYAKHDPDVFRGKTVLCPCDDPERSNFTSYFRRNFQIFEMKRLISTCISQEAREGLFGEPGKLCGKYLDITAGSEKKGALKGGGDFRSEELCQLRDEADIIVTNPPFSLFREFIKWILEASSTKKFLVLGNMNAITYKEVFPLIKGNRMWTGTTWRHSFEMPDDYPLRGQPYEKDGKKYAFSCSSCWFTNLEYGKRHEPLKLHTMEWNREHSRHKKMREAGYPHYDNYDAIEVPYVDAIPSDYDGIMGVPISFLEKFCQEQFEIVGLRHGGGGKGLAVAGKPTYCRILIRHRRPGREGGLPQLSQNTTK